MLTTIIQQMNAETITFIVIITSFSIFFHWKFTTNIVHKAPAILTTLGILGTFIGIAFGLLHFNANDVQKSVPTLIDGIKTAVWVSAWGIFCALTIKVREIILGVQKKITHEKSSGSTIDDLASILTSVQQALVGNDDSTLLSQMKLARQDSNDRLDKLSHSMEDFCRKVAESNSKALIEALEVVIRDFNVKINEQFGDNFKQLNQAVGQLLLWQIQYREQMTTMIDQQNSASSNMAIAAERYQLLVENAEIFNTVAHNMSGLITGLETQRTQISESLKLLASLINTASTGLPEIEKNIIQMTKQISDGVNTANKEIKTVLLAGIQSSNQEINTNIKQIIDNTKEQVTALDKALEVQLTKSLQSLGSQLASLSNKFADDYTPLTVKLNAILKMAS